MLHVGFRIEPAPDGPFFGFEVDRDRLFLLADFTVVHNCYDVWADQLAELRPAFYTGHETPRQKDEAVSRFIDGDTDLLVLSLRSGAGIDGLQHRCSTVAFGEFDWSPGVHDQCVGRVFRDGQTDPVTAFYLATEFGSDPTVLGVLGVKSDQSQQLLDPAGNPFQVQQADPHRVTRLAEAWLRSRNLNAAKILADNPHAA